MLCLTNLMEFLPMIIPPASRLISPVSKVIVICLAILWNPQLLAAADENTTKEFSVCMEQSQGVTPKMFDCLGDELNRQDSRLNDNYKKLMSKLSPNRKKMLLGAQRAWIKFRKTNCDFYFDPDGGSAARISASDCSVTTTAARAKELKDLLPE
jgi:uncharacterized protein YecT (DUF1311 family)